MMQSGVDRLFPHCILGAVLSLCANAPLLAQDVGPSGEVRALPGPCQARDTDDSDWWDLAVGGALVAGATVICQQEGRLAYTLPGTGVEVARLVRIGEKVVVARGRLSPTPVEGTRPGLRAEASPEGVASFGAVVDAMQWLRETQSSVRASTNDVKGASSGAATGALAGSPLGWARYIAELRAAANGDEARVVARVAADVRQETRRVATLDQTVAEWLADGRTSPSARPEDAASSPTNDKMRQRDEHRLRSLTSHVRAAENAAEGYKEAASLLRVEPSERRSLDTELDRLRVGVRQLEARLSELTLYAPRTRPAAPAASALP